MGRFTLGTVRTIKKNESKMHLMTDFIFERSLNDLFCDFAADILNFIVCANKKAILPQFQDEMIRLPSRCLQEIKIINYFFIK